MGKNKKGKQRRITGEEASEQAGILPDGRHPEDVIFAARTFIRELSRVQEERFGQLVAALGVDDEGADYLFDYIHNSDELEGFDEYLERLDRQYAEFLATPRG